MKVLLISTAFNGLSQRVWCDLKRAGHEVEQRVLPEENDKLVRNWIEETSPDAIITPFLKCRIATDLGIPTVILHPGLPGDAGPASIDWAILNREATWGIEAIDASDIIDGGDVHAWREFSVFETTSKSQMYGDQITDAASAVALETLERIAAGTAPTPQSAMKLRGELRRGLKNADRHVDFNTMSADDIARIVRASDGQPGARTTIDGTNYRIYDAHREDSIRATPGQIKAKRNGALLIGTLTKALWIGMAKLDAPGQIKLPAARVIPHPLSTERALEPWRQHEGSTFQDLRLRHHGAVTVIQAAFYNGAFSVERSKRVLEALEYAEMLNQTKIVVLTGGANYYSNGIDLNTIQAAEDSALEAWESINAINAIAMKISSYKKAIITSISGNAGAGGVMVGLGADRIVARRGAVLNGHYKGMGLYGSELWTYHLPRRIGATRAEQMTDGMLPITSEDGLEIGLIDAVLPRDYATYQQAVTEYATALLPNASQMVSDRLERNAKARPPLEAHIASELAQMNSNMFGDSLGFKKHCEHFVLKVPQCGTPDALTKHRDLKAQQHQAPQPINHNGKPVLSENPQ